MNSKRRTVALLGSVLLVSLLWTTLAEAQVQDNRWSTPYRLSTEESTYSSGSHVIAADQYGYVHVFWVETTFPDALSVIQYARFDGQTWSYPLDIYATASSIDLLSPVADASGNLHLVWTEGQGFRRNPAFYMYAPTRDALSARQWSTPVPIEIEAHLLKLQVDSMGVIHIFFSKFFEPDPGIYYLRSEDQGQTWSDPLWLDPDIPPDYAPGALQFVLDENDGLHAVWFYIPSEEAGGDWLRYTHSLDGGDTWPRTFTIDKDDEGRDDLRATVDPVLIVQGQTVHVIWAGGELNYRNHRLSKDAGRSWDVSRRVLGNLNGQAQDGLAVDGASRVHFFGQLRFPQGIYHAYWDSDRWVAPMLVYLIRRDSTDLINGRYHAHGLRPAVRAGNQLVLTFYDRAEDGRPHVLYTMHRTLDDVSVSPLAPTPTSVPTIQPSPTPGPEVVATPQRTQFEAGDISPPATAPTPAGSLWSAIVPTLLLVGGTVVVRLLQKRNT